MDHRLDKPGILPGHTPIIQTRSYPGTTLNIQSTDTKPIAIQRLSLALGPKDVEGAVPLGDPLGYVPRRDR